MLRHMLMRVLRLAAMLALVVLAAACGDTVDQVAQEASPPRGGPSCEERAVDVPPDSAISWAHYLRFGDRVYTTTGEPADAALAVGERLGSVTCTRSGSRTPVQHLIRDGEAAYLEAGTEFHALAGRSPDDAITAVFGGERLVFTPDAMLTTQLAEAQRPSSDVLEVRSDGAPVEVCTAPTPVDLPNTECRRLAPDAAARLSGALDGAAPYGVGEPCERGDGRVYKIVIGEPDASRELVVTLPCGPLTEGTRRYQVADDLGRAVIHEHEAA